MNCLLLIKVLPEEAKRNSFTAKLVETLRMANLGGAVDYGNDWRKLLAARSYDVINIHWPELIPVASRQDQATIVKTLVALRGKARIILTVHNLQPHGKHREWQYENLYKPIIGLADGFIHFSPSAKQIFEAAYQHDIRPAASHFVIPHGNYAYLDNTSDTTTARKYLNIQEDAKVFVSFGAHRNFRELQLLVGALLRARIRNKLLILAGRVDFKGSNRLTRKALTYGLQILKRFDALRVYGGGIEQEDVQYFMNAADALVIPRIHTLNSGNVYLGLTFGTAIIAPDYSTSRDVCLNTGNPLYQTGSTHSLAKQMEYVASMDKSQLEDLRLRNRGFARRELDWKHIGEKYVEAFGYV